MGVSLRLVFVDGMLESPNERGALFVRNLLRFWACSIRAFAKTSGSQASHSCGDEGRSVQCLARRVA